MGIKYYRNTTSGDINVPEVEYDCYDRVSSFGTLSSPYSSPAQAQSFGAADGNYYFRSGSMSSPLLMEYKNNYYESRSWVCVFRSPYNSTATTNLLNLNIPMGGLLVQRDTLDIRAAVYWSTPITYVTIGNASPRDTADSGYSPRRVMLGNGGGHGIYNTSQDVCNWGNSSGAVGAGYDGGSCGSFPDGLRWGTGTGGPVYSNMSGTWSHWVYWT